MNVRRIAVLALFVVLGGGCGTTPRTDYYLLSAMASRPATLHGEGPSIGLASLRVAEYLQRPEILVLESANRLRLREYARWAEPLPDGIERVLMLNVATLLDSDRVRSRPWPRGWTPEWQLRVEILQLDVRDATAELLVNWSLARATQAFEHSDRITVPHRGGDAESVAADFSTLLLALAEKIAAAVATDQAAAAQQHGSWRQA